MNPEVKAKWTARLRSGQDKQGAGVLHRRQNGEDFFCCLGILCEVAIENGVAVNKAPEPGSDATHAILAYDGYEDFLPLKVQEWAGFSVGNPLSSELCGESGSTVRLTLSWLNDQGRTFSEIADIIERDF